MLKNALAKTCLSVALALSVVAGAMTTASQPAEARRGVGVGIGIAAAIIAGAAISSHAYGYPRSYRYSRYSSDGCYLGPRQCRRTGGDCYENRFGETVCRGGSVRCYRPTVCD